MVLKKWIIPVLFITGFLLFVLMLLFPEPTWQAGIRGLAIWWDVLFPSLFPFFVLSEIMLGLGIVHFLGKLLDPLMKPLFNIPGSGGFALAMGFASGYPVSAKLTTQLRQLKLVSREEGERLVAFTTSADPIFLVGAVSVGFFGNPDLAGILALSHYGSALMVGLLLRYYGMPRNKNNHDLRTLDSEHDKWSLRLALEAMYEARKRDGRSLGELLRGAVLSSLQLMIIVGGLVVFFSVMLEVLTVSGIMTTLYHSLGLILPKLGLPSSLAEPFISGLFEVTLGARASATAGDIPLVFKAAAASFILSWGGLSVHAQVSSILNGADLRYLPFLAARVIHSFFAAILVLLLWNPLMDSLPAFSFSPFLLPRQNMELWGRVTNAVFFFLKIISALLILSLFQVIIQRIIRSFKNK